MTLLINFAKYILMLIILDVWKTFFDAEVALSIKMYHPLLMIPYSHDITTNYICVNKNQYVN